MARILQLGAGLVGKTIATDLAGQHSVTVVDISEHNLIPLKTIDNIRPVHQDATDINAIAPLINDADVIVGALPGFLGYQANKSLIPFGKPIVDISFFPEDPWALDRLAKQHNVLLALDCGLAPGMSNLFCGHYASEMEVHEFKCLVGGLPQDPKPPLKYKAVFSPVDVIEEYTRPARLVKAGKITTVDALTDLECFTVNDLELEAFNTDGLRTLLQTTKIPNMVEKTIRYRDTTHYLSLLADLGFFSAQPLSVKGQNIKPVDLTAELLIPQWSMSEKDRDITIMLLSFSGEQNGKSVTVNYRLIDRYDETTATTSMARTTGFTCAAVTNFIFSEGWNHTGLCPLEYFGQDKKAYHYILDYLSQRGVRYQKL